jgi:hypothetical protein
VLPFRIEDVAPSKSLEFFLSAQHWMDAFPPPRDAHYRALVGYLRAQLAVSPPPSLGRSDAAPGPYGAAAPGSVAGEAAPGVKPSDAGLSAGRLAHIEAELASYIGPLARFLVQREVRRAAGAEDLIARLSTELETESDRSKFAQSCRHPPGVR